MVLTPRLDQRQSQSLVMTPQLQQAIKLLQMSNLELAGYIEQELESNPLLERDDGANESGNDQADNEAGSQSDSQSGDLPGDQAGDKSGDQDANFDEQPQIDSDSLSTIDFDSKPGDVDIPDEAGYDVDYDNTYNNTSDAEAPAQPLQEMNFTAGAGGGGSGGYDGDLPGIEETVSEKPTMREHLLEQLHMDVVNPVDRMIGHHLIGALDETGYITGDLTDIADTLGCPLEHVEATLVAVQGFDPTGIFARNLRECLSLQLRERDRLDPAMAALMDNLDLVAKREFTALCKICGVDMEDVTDMVLELRSLNPKPGLDFEHDLIQVVTPDVFMRAQPSGGWYLELNNQNLPKVLVNNHYFSKVTKAPLKKTDKDYINEQFQTANWLVKALHQRATTILKVASEIVRQQDAFFRKGVQHLKPLVLRNIADVIDMHESTVSRVTSNKYISTPRGIYELKYFFTSSIASSTGGDAISAESVRHKIKDLIDAEDPKKILSDDKITDILNGEGMDVARRTVAKYRESLSLGSSVQRRREKSAPK